MHSSQRAGPLPLKLHQGHRSYTCWKIRQQSIGVQISRRWGYRQQGRCSRIGTSRNVGLRGLPENTWCVWSTCKAMFCEENSEALVPESPGLFESINGLLNLHYPLSGEFFCWSLMFDCSLMRAFAIC